MARLPEFITFTGLDERTDVAALVEISTLYPVEWGILLSDRRMGVEPRYPTLKVADRFRDEQRLRLALHACGDVARELIRRCDEGVSTRFARLQLNVPGDMTLTARSAADRIRELTGVVGIVQWRTPNWPHEAHPLNTRVDWLFDRSGGRGERPSFWPPHPGKDRLVGYAGGITPENVLETIEAIASDGPYWIDMESGVRTDDWLDVAKVRAVCEAVYGKREWFA